MASILPQDTITEVRELIITPPTEKPYDVLRETVTTSVTASTHKRISQLLEQETIGDSKPSQFLKRLQKLAEGATDKSIVKHIFLQRIPTQYKVAIAACINCIWAQFSLFCVKCLFSLMDSLIRVRR